ELKNVPLANAQMFQQPPGAVRDTRDGAAAEGGRNAGHRLVELQVGAAALEEIEEVFAEGLVRIGSHGYVSERSSIRRRPEKSAARLRRICSRVRTRIPSPQSGALIT